MIIRKSMSVSAVLALAMLAGAVSWSYLSGQHAAAESATKDLPTGYLRATESFVREFQDVKKAYEHLQGRVPANYIYDDGLRAFRPTAPGTPVTTPAPAAPAVPPSR